MSRLAEWSTGGNYMKGGVGCSSECMLLLLLGRERPLNRRTQLSLIGSLQLQRRALGRNGARASAAIEIIERSHRFVESWLDDPMLDYGCGIWFPPLERRQDEGRWRKRSAARAKVANVEQCR
jgi:hypothetical protein